MDFCFYRPVKELCRQEFSINRGRSKGRQLSANCSKSVDDLDPANYFALALMTSEGTDHWVIVWERCKDLKGFEVFVKLVNLRTRGG